MEKKNILNQRPLGQLCYAEFLGKNSRIFISKDDKIVCTTTFSGKQMLTVFLPTLLIHDSPNSRMLSFLTVPWDS